jgi:hypothetical protein
VLVLDADTGALLSASRRGWYSSRVDLPGRQAFVQEITRAVDRRRLRRLRSATRQLTAAHTAR